MKTQRKFSALALAIALIATLLSSCGGASQPPPAATATTPGAAPSETAPASEGAASPTAEPFTIRTSSKLECTATPFVIADKLGFFAEENLTLEYTGELTTSGAAVAALLNGTNDVLDTHPNTLATFINEGAALKAVSLNIVDPPEDAPSELRHMRLYASQTNDQVNSLADIASYKPEAKLKIVGTVPSCTTYILNNIFTNNGLDPSRIEWTTADSTSAALQALELGDLDFVFIHPPFYYIAEQAGYKLIADSFDSGLGPAAGTYLYVFSEDFIASNPDVVQRFINAIKKAQAYANENLKEAAELTAEHIQQEVRATHYYYTGDGIPRSYVQPWLDDLVANGAFDEGAVTVDDLITFQFEPELP
ncbi:MAG: ABC transporter substrate-binding protein [Oscillospiraceae bacterium]|jgi:ABC-type nitrate/sulfonate/bicarbonate transport system substrate-binding protein|nr:ABC transporter substrate-binding protein [Oscillospiraceae bacterium]